MMVDEERPIWVAFVEAILKQKLIKCSGTKPMEPAFGHQEI